MVSLKGRHHIIVNKKQAIFYDILLVNCLALFSMPQYIFIYDHHGVGPNSRDDLKEFFTNYPIYREANVQLSDFNCNFDGLSAAQITFVLPGGSTYTMGKYLKFHQNKMQTLIEAGSHGLFICAGAYLAVAEAEIFCDHYIKQPGDHDFSPLRFWMNTAEQNLNLNFLPEYKAWGSFIPNETYLAYPQDKLSSRTLKPYLTSLCFSHHRFYSRELFIAGCGFESLTQEAEVVATYTDKDQYSFFSPGKKAKIMANMPAIVRKPGLLASGVHIEACVENSKLLSLMSEGKNTNPPSVLALSTDLSYDAKSSRAAFIPLLQDTFRPR